MLRKSGAMVGRGRRVEGALGQGWAELEYDCTFALCVLAEFYLCLKVTEQHRLSVFLLRRAVNTVHVFVK